ncbi:MAG TPA: hypothetical protein VI298_09225 [Geobacteraceae bacterium]
MGQQRQLNVRIDTEFADRLEMFAKKHHRTMGDVIEMFVSQGIEEVETDERFEAESLDAWQKYVETGECVSLSQIETRFKKALSRATEVATKDKAD